MARPIRNLDGLRFGKLVIFEFDATSKPGHPRWLAMCECLRVKSFDHYNLISGKTGSCGCKSPETIEKIRVGATKHGMSRTATYKSWMAMKHRCLNPDSSKYPDYGGRGIKVYSEWMNFDAFYADMGECPLGLTLDRYPDNDGDYGPENCRWATASEQQNNKRTTRVLTAFGKSQTLSEWSLETGLSVNLLRNRIDAHGWSEEKALSVPKKHYNLSI